MTLEGRRVKLDEISAVVLKRMQAYFKVTDPSTLMVSRNQYSGEYELKDGWRALAQSVVEDLAARGIIDLNKSNCRCSLDVLMVGGCKCGEMQRSKG